VADTRVLSAFPCLYVLRRRTEGLSRAKSYSVKHQFLVFRLFAEKHTERTKASQECDAAVAVIKPSKLSGPTRLMSGPQEVSLSAMGGGPRLVDGEQ